MQVQGETQSTIMAPSRYVYIHLPCSTPVKSNGSLFFKGIKFGNWYRPPRDSILMDHTLTRNRLTEIKVKEKQISVSK